MIRSTAWTLFTVYCTACATTGGHAAQGQEERFPRVLILGDSISIGYTPIVREVLSGQCVVIRPTTADGRPENCQGTRHGVEHIDRWLALGNGRWDVIHFNFGLHDMKRVDPQTGAVSTNPADPRQSSPEKYEAQLRQIVARLKQTGARLIFATTTPVPDGGVRPHRDVKDPNRYNDVARKIMQEHDVAVNDLFAFAFPRLGEIQQPVNVHFTQAGSKALAERVVASIRAALKESAQRPNILIAISDDQSYPHAAAYGYAAARTPAFDRVAAAGVLFRNAFTPAPGCSPMRAAFLTGRQIWQIEHAGAHASSFPAQYEVFPDRLEAAGYFVGQTGKGWGPGNWEVSGRSRNPAGPSFSRLTADTPPGVRNTDYAANFAEFLAQCPEDRPFCFWYGASEPHRAFQKGIGRRHGIDPDQVDVPPFLPDTPEVREDIADYLFEIWWFDQHLRRMLKMLEDAGRLAGTLVIVTSDNGMSFPRAKANVYEYGIHMPLAVSWPARVPAGRAVDDLVSLIDLTTTIYDAAGVAPPVEHPPSGSSLLGMLTSNGQGVVEPQRNAVYSGRERHSSSRYHSLGYPQRAIRTHDYLYIRNFRPERWPAGAPRKYDRGGYAGPGDVVQRRLGPPHGGYHDIDACPTLSLLVERRDDPRIGRFLELAVGKRPAEELFLVGSDPGCLENLAGDPAHAEVRKQLSDRLTAYLRETGDPRVVADDGGDVFETYPRYSPLRWFPTPDWAEEDPNSIPRQPWLEAQRAKLLKAASPGDASQN